MLRKAAEMGQRATPETGGRRGSPLVEARDQGGAPTLAEIGITRDQSSRYQHNPVVLPDLGLPTF